MPRVTSTIGGRCCRGCRSSSRRPIRWAFCRRPRSTAGLPGTIGAFNIEQRFPFFGYNTLFNISGNVTKIKGAHTMKTGLFVERTTRPASRTSSFNGNFSFNTDNQNPLNTNVGFANGLLGAITEYTESDGHPSAHGEFFITEWYAQDSWRLKRNLTFDAGVRFYYMTPTQSQGDDVAAFVPDRWTATQAPSLYQPVIVNGARVARNPLTNQTLPAVYIGRLVPGSGNFINGMQVFDGTPQQTSPFRAAPRASFAWDVTGDGKTAVRGGGGIFYDRYADDIILDLIELPPVLNTYRTNYTTINELLGAPLTSTPSAARLVDEFTPPVVYNWSIGMQRDIGFNLIADAAYVGNAGRNQLVTMDINGRPYGYAYQPSSLDPTTVVGGQAQPYAGRLPAALPGSRAHPAADVRRLRGLSLAPVRREPAALRRRPVGRRLVHLPALQQEPRDDRSVRREQ